VKKVFLKVDLDAPSRAAFCVVAAVYNRRNDCRAGASPAGSFLAVPFQDKSDGTALGNRPGRAIRSRRFIGEMAVAATH